MNLPYSPPDCINKEDFALINISMPRENIRYPPSRSSRNYIKKTLPKCYNPPPKHSDIKEAMSRKNGHRPFFLTNKIQYRGCWKNNMKNGHGKETDKTTIESYEGTFHEDKRSGYGVISRKKSNGIQELLYEGGFANGIPCGKGGIHTDTYHFTGSVVDGKASGTGIAWFKDGTVYSGNWFNGKRMGKGIQIFRDQNRYEGSWYNDRKHGYGQHFFFDKGLALEGVWVADVCRCGTMRNIKYRQAAKDPSIYPIPKLMMEGWETKYYLREKEVWASVGKYVREDVGINYEKKNDPEISSDEESDDNWEQDMKDHLSNVLRSVTLKLPASMTYIQPCLILKK